MDGDNWHPAANVAKMSRGIALTDEVMSGGIHAVLVGESPHWVAWTNLHELVSSLALGSSPLVAVTA